MRYRSTRNADMVTLEQAMSAGLAPDGGLYVPEALPAMGAEAFAGARSLTEIAATLLAPFFEGSRLQGELGAIVREALNFPVPLKPLPGDDPLSVLELFHGPTAAFKDVGARFLAACLARVQAERPQAGPMTILVATSGDTGGAVAAAFHRRPGFRVVVLFPEGQVSPRQQHQLTCWGDNVDSVAVRGPFDACQNLVKAAFADEQLRHRHRLSSANSINIGRLLPQLSYYAAASLWHFRTSGAPSSFVIPAGNMGNALACIWARQIGLPIDEVVLATNANLTLTEFLRTGEYQPRPSVRTLASAMDVGDPSNVERLRDLIPDMTELRRRLQGQAVSDEEIREQIRSDVRRRGEVWCPHTATAAHVYDSLPRERRRGRHWVLVATAHPAKFDTVVEPLVGREVPVPDSLGTLLERPSHFETIVPDVESLKAIIEKNQ